uniref:Uncharacterized protein n=1 Tax=Rhipicephalus pulchellus TaxID=72859 RepID=L7LVN4_RHIPC
MLLQRCILWFIGWSLCFERYFVHVDSLLQQTLLCFAFSINRVFLLLLLFFFFFYCALFIVGFVYCIYVTPQFFAFFLSMLF